MKPIETRERNVQQIFDIRSEYFNNLEWVFDQGFLSQLLRVSRPRASDIMLDLAAGTGAIAQIFAGKVRSICALDLSARMLKHATELLGDATDVSFVIADGQRSCFLTRTFDLIVCRNGLHHFADPLLGLHEASRILKPQGVLVLIEPVAPNDVAKGAWSELFRIRDKGRHPDFYFTTHQLGTFVKKTGFEVEAIEERILAVRMSNWLATGCLSPQDLEQVYWVLEHLPPKTREYLGVNKDESEWIMFHTWCLLRLRKEIADGS
jgi:ubiquinone/menaquinone biosynthesis C-methylase UbiE